MKLEIQTDLAPVPNGHYSQAVAHNGVLYLSIQLPLDPVTKELPDGIEAQVAQVLNNCEAILAAGGSALALVLSATVYLTDDADWPAVDAEFSRRFGTTRPARGVVFVPSLRLGASVAMLMIAAIRPC
jgi:2-iminobutanoate/2-iminopropanoate deaminase